MYWGKQQENHRGAGQHQFCRESWFWVWKPVEMFTDWECEQPSPLSLLLYDGAIHRHKCIVGIKCSNSPIPVSDKG